VLGFIAFVTIVLGFATLMVFSSMPNEISSIGEILPTYVGYDSNYNVGNV